MKGGKENRVAPYLLLGPRQLALELPVLVKQDLVFPAQSCEAVTKLLGELDDCGLRLAFHC